MNTRTRASVAFRMKEIMVIYPITPLSPMAEWCDEWSANGRKNLWGAIPSVAVDCVLALSQFCEVA